jgi:hypothetical protein
VGIELLNDGGDFLCGGVSLDEDVGDARLSFLEDDVLKFLHVPLGISDNAKAVSEDTYLIVVPDANFGELGVALTGGIDPVATVNHALIGELADDADGLLTDCRLSLLCACAAMVRAIDSWVLGKSILPLTSLGRWLPVEHVESTPEVWASLQLGKECFIVDYVATARVDEDCILFHLAKEVSIDHSLGLCRGRSVDRDYVSVREQIILAHVREAHLLVHAWLLGTCGDDDIHAKGLGSLANELTDVTEANDSDGAATDSLAGGKHSFVPFLVLEERVAFSCAAVDR